MMDRVKYPEVDPKSVDHASREDQIEGYIDAPDSDDPGGGMAFSFMRDTNIVTGKGVPQNDRGGFVGRAHGWER